MKKILKSIVLALLFVSMVNCQNNDQQEMKEKLIEALQKEMKNYKYKYKPVYSCQVNKYNCRLIIEIEGSTDVRFIENNGESMLLPLNPLLIKSGKQKAIIKVYPFEGEKYIDAGANVNLTFYNASDKESNLSEYKKIATFSLPDGIGKQKLPYYESVVEFDVTVPFDYSEELDKAYDLTQIQNIEERIVSRYNYLRDLGLSSNDAEFKTYGIHSYKRHLNNIFFTSKINIEKAINGISALCDSRLKNKVILPIENYDVQFYAGGKIVGLWQKNMNSILYIKGTFTNNEGDINNFEGGQPIFLYMPAGSSELKEW